MLPGGHAVDERFQGPGLGGFLLAHALRGAHHAAKRAGPAFVVVDAIDERAVSFYEAHGFIRAGRSDRLFLPMATIRRLYQAKAATSGTATAATIDAAPPLPLC